MTRAESRPQDNGGVCEGCHRPETRHQTQATYPVFLGGGLGWGTLWLCSDCLSRHKLRDEGKNAGEGAPGAPKR